MNDEKWEYKIRISFISPVNEDGPSWLTQLGRDGWELIQVVNYDNRELVYFFKRPLPKRNSNA